jgi:hypothetical protein
MGPIQRSAASIGFYGDDLEPSAIMERLGRPTVGVKMGDVYLTPGGREKVARTGSWRLVAEDREPSDLDCQINALLDQLSDDFGSWRHFCSRFRGRMFCGLFLGDTNEGLSLRPETLARLGERGLLLDLDIYAISMPD